MLCSTACLAGQILAEGTTPQRVCPDTIQRAKWRGAQRVKRRWRAHDARDTLTSCFALSQRIHHRFTIPSQTGVILMPSWVKAKNQR